MEERRTADAAYEAEARAEAARAYPNSGVDQESFLTAALGRKPTTIFATHSLERTSPRGPGMKFIGRCARCGLTDLPMSAALEPCENYKRMSDDDALLHAIRGGK